MSREFDLAYGRTSIKFSTDDDRFSIISDDATAQAPLTDIQIGVAFDGTIVLLAECSNGLGRDDFLKWFDAEDSRALENRLRNGYEVNGQTAWSLLAKAERFRVCLVSQLPDDQVRMMRMNPVRTIEEALDQAGASDGFIMPRGAAVLPRLEI